MGDTHVIPILAVEGARPGKFEFQGAIITRVRVTFLERNEIYLMSKFAAKTSKFTPTCICTGGNYAANCHRIPGGGRDVKKGFGSAKP